MPICSILDFFIDLFVFIWYITSMKQAIPPSVQQLTDSYFQKTRAIVEKFGDVKVKYAVFMRRPVVFAPRLAVDWLEEQAKFMGQKITIELLYKESQFVGAGEPMLYFSGSFAHLVELETLLLQKIGPACVAAYNAYSMCSDLPKTQFLAMDARHCAGNEMMELMAYAASVGSMRAKRKQNAVGFIGNATDWTAHFFGNSQGLGTMPHALVGYAGSTLKACEYYHQTFPNSPITILVDYFGQEITDSLEVCAKFSNLQSQNKLSIRLDTIGGRYCEGLDSGKSYQILLENCPDAIKGYRSEQELKHLIGPGVSAAAIWHLRKNLDEAGFNQTRIVASSGFNPEKCRVMGIARAPIDVIGTGSYLPDKWQETYATADIIQYGDKYSVKLGREFLFPQQ